MDAQDGGAAAGAVEMGGKSGGQPLGRDLAAGDAPQRRLARGAEQDRAAQHAEPVEVADQVEILARRLAEADAGVDHDLPARNAGGGRDGDGAFEEAADIVEDVEGGVDGVAVVHQHHRGAGPGRDRGDARVALGAPDVVDDRCSCSESDLRDLRLVAVDRDRRVASCLQPGDDGKHAGKLRRGIDGFVAGPGRLAADIDDRRAFGD